MVLLKLYGPEVFFSEIPPTPQYIVKVVGLLLEQSPGLVPGPLLLLEQSPGLVPGPPLLLEQSPGLVPGPLLLLEQSPGLVPGPLLLLEQSPGLVPGPPLLLEQPPWLVPGPLLLSEQSPGLVPGPLLLLEQSPGLVPGPLLLLEQSPGLVPGPLLLLEQSPGLVPGPLLLSEQSPGKWHTGPCQYHHISKRHLNVTQRATNLPITLKLAASWYHACEMASIPSLYNDINRELQPSPDGTVAPLTMAEVVCGLFTLEPCQKPCWYEPIFRS